MYHLPPLSHIRAFETAARHQSFVLAAKELGISSAAVSQHVRALEDWLAIPLFVRRARGVVLTAKGRDFATACSRSLGELSTAGARLRESGVKRKVSLACQPSIVSLWLSGRLPDFRAAHPDIQLSIVYPFGAKRPEEVGANLLICHGLSAAGPAERILDAQTRPTCARSYLDRHGPFDTPDAILKGDLLHDETEQAWQDWFALHGLDIPPGHAPVFADFNLLIGSIRAGHGIGLCPTSLIADDLKTGDLVQLSDTPCDRDKFYWLVGSGQTSPAATELRHWLLAQADMRHNVAPRPHSA